jgi:hypothetical protein
VTGFFTASSQGGKEYKEDIEVDMVYKYWGISGIILDRINKYINIRCKVLLIRYTIYLLIHVALTLFLFIVLFYLIIDLYIYFDFFALLFLFI